MASYITYTDEQIRQAKETDIVELAKSIGLTPVKKGRFWSLKEYDSVMIYPNHLSYSRFSDHTGGDAIEFLKNFANMDFQEAIRSLLEKNGLRVTVHQEPQQAPRQFELPPQSETHSRVFAYMNRTRCISRETLDFLLKNKLIYEDDHHNVVFVGYDKDGTAKYASKRGTNTFGESYKRDVAGSDKSCSFNIVNRDSDLLVVTEAPIDAISFMDLMKRHDMNVLALGGTAPVALDHFLKEYDHIEKIWLLLDCDGAGSRGTKKILENLEGSRYQVRDKRNIEGMANKYAKDLNEFLVNFNRPDMLQEAQKRHFKAISEIMEAGYKEEDAVELNRLISYQKAKIQPEDLKEMLKNTEFCGEVLRVLREIQGFEAESPKTTLFKLADETYLSVADDVFNVELYHEMYGREGVTVSKENEKQEDQEEDHTAARNEKISDKELDASVKTWYCSEYKTDTLGLQLNPDVTFRDVALALDYRKDFYSIIGVGDSVIRQRVFKELTERMDTDYNVVYDSWLGDGSIFTSDRIELDPEDKEHRAEPRRDPRQEYVPPAGKPEGPSYGKNNQIER